MPKKHKPRGGSLQFWPRVRTKKILPSVNWHFVNERVKANSLLGFIGYKVGMTSVIVQDLTPDSMTKNKQIALPVTIIECPLLKIFSIRFYKDNKPVKEIVVSNDKELKRILRVPKKIQENEIEKIGVDYDDIHLIVYSIVKKLGLKKTPDIGEIAISGDKEKKFEIAKSLIGKEINVEDIFSKGMLVDVHAVTKGKGIQGPLKRFGIGKKPHKTEKGVRRPGTLGPWTPKRVSFRAPISGQLGYFTRVQYNNKILDVNNIEKKNINASSGFTNYGIIRGSYIILKGSVSGPAKRQLMLTFATRPQKKMEKQKYEIIKVEK